MPNAGAKSYSPQRDSKHYILQGFVFRYNANHRSIHYVKDSSRNEARAGHLIHFSIDPSFLASSVLSLSVYL